MLNVGKVSVQNLNKLLNNWGQISIMGVESPSSEISPHICDMFSFVTLYKESTDMATLAHSEKGLKEIQSFDKKVFNEYVVSNF